MFHIECALLCRLQQLSPAFFLDAHQPRLQRLSKEGVVFLLQRGIAPPTAGPQLADRDGEPAGDFFHLKGSGLEKLGVIGRNADALPGGAAFQQGDTVGVA